MTTSINTKILGTILVSYGPLSIRLDTLDQWWENVEKHMIKEDSNNINHEIAFGFY